ncbi:MAG: TauD/TfdA dioxygenase family protein [Rhodospirillales bacterium]
MTAEAMKSAVSLDISPLTPTFGAEISGVDLSQPISDQLAAAIVDAFHQYSALVFRGQDMTPAEFSRFSSIFGELDVHHLAEHTFPDHPEVRVLSNMKKDNKHVGQFRGGHFWHTDISYKKKVALATILHGKICPPVGADSLVADMYAAYESMPESLKKKLEGKMAIHDRNFRYEFLYPERPPLTPEQISHVPPVEHPCIIAHPETGRKAVYIVEHFVSRIGDLDEDESQELVKEVIQFVTQPQFVYAHKWQVGDVAMWDDRCTLHSATSYEYDKYDRLLYRTQIKGGEPFYRA